MADVAGRAPGAHEPLGLDSLGHAELVLALEEAFGVGIPDDATFTTPAEVADVLRGRVTSVGDPGALVRGVGPAQAVVRDAIEALVRRYLRVRVEGRLHVPASGPAVLAANHESLLDIPLIVVASPRPVVFMAKRELFAKPAVARLLRVLGGFPVRRGRSDVAAVRTALAVVSAGRVLAMYPEGTRALGLNEYLPGAAWVALATGAPLVPVAIRGSGEAMPPAGAHWPRRTGIRVAFGASIEVELEPDPVRRRARANEVTETLRSRTAELLG
ncbi:MAG: 1-acyl-sn-glycerol-3-phosphate acyltransferase [Actinomycetota bacterium]|nr:1-acyl-sn-glycerol-3-phosphate acyltransferase [Actinomycetota bacterium]